MKDTSIWALGLIAVLLCSLLLQLQAARGTFWRGRDCRDWDVGSYPGRQPFRGDKTADYNCNGIWGVDRVTGKPWEDILCKDFDSRGIIYIGDSVGAHFHFPESWINPLIMSEVSTMDYVFCFYCHTITFTSDFRILFVFVVIFLC